MTSKSILVPLLAACMLWTCQTEQVIVDRVVHDTVWIEKPPIRIVETITDTVWQTRIVNDTVVVTREVIVTDTVLVEKIVQLVDTVYQDVIKQVTVIELDTVYITKTEIVESRLTIVHPGSNNYNGIYHWNESITTWLNKVKQYGLKPKAATVIFTPIRWGNPTFGIEDYKMEDGSYLVYMEFHDDVAIWRALSHVLLDIPLIPLDPEETEWGTWDGGDYTHIPKYDHLMFQFFFSGRYWEFSDDPERQEWYWEDMLTN